MSIPPPCRTTFYGRCFYNGFVQTKVAPTQISHPWETGEDADRGPRGGQTAGTGNEGTIPVEDRREDEQQQSSVVEVD